MVGMHLHLRVRFFDALFALARHCNEEQEVKGYIPSGTRRNLTSPV